MRGNIVNFQRIFCGTSLRNIAIFLVTFVFLFKLFTFNLWSSDVNLSDKRKPLMWKPNPDDEVGTGIDTNETAAPNDAENVKIILYWNTLFGKKNFGLGFGRQIFENANCTFSACTTTDDRTRFDDADMVIFHGFQMRAADMPVRNRHDQIWLYYNLENPFRSAASVKGMNDKFNLTVTYLDSPDTDIRYHVMRVPTTKAYHPPDASTIGAKSRMVAWIVSDCSVHSTRAEYVQELSKYVQVDVYGDCGNLTCSRHPKNASAKCYQRIEAQYFFYLALENGYCKDYMSEKPVIATRMNIVPIVLGYVNYSQILPPNSFIDVRDFMSPRHLADYLIRLSKNTKQYMNYLKWKSDFPYILRIKGFKQTLICRLCEILHDRNYKYKTRFDLENYWNPNKLCLVGDEERNAVHLKM